MDFGSAIKSGFQNYVTFRGRAPRSEFWYWTLFAMLVTIAGQIADTAVFESPNPGLFAPLIGLGLFLPGWAVAIRRLHDLDRTGWWFLVVFTIVGIILLVIWACKSGTKGSNRFGPDPLAIAGSPQ